MTAPPAAKAAFSETAADLAVLEAACSREVRELHTAFQVLLRRLDVLTPTSVLRASLTTKAVVDLFAASLQALKGEERQAAGFALARTVLRASENQRKRRFATLPSDGPREDYIQAVLREGRRIALLDEHSDAQAAGLAVVALCHVDGTPQASIGYGGVGNALQNDPPRLAALLRDLALHIEQVGAT